MAFRYSIFAIQPSSILNLRSSFYAFLDIKSSLAHRMGEGWGEGQAILHPPVIDPSEGHLEVFLVRA
jgi:hypothetical protein